MKAKTEDRVINYPAFRGDMETLERLMRRGEYEPFTEYVTITPGMAQALLDRNENNRPTSPQQIGAIAHDIRSGRWQVNGETIIVAKDGHLNDGQNRLLAVVEAGIAITSAVSFGLPRESRFSVDMGRQRTSGQFLSMQGVQNSYNAAATITLYELYKKGLYRHSIRTSATDIVLTKQDILGIYNDNKERIDEAVLVATSSKAARAMGATAFAVAYLIIKPLNQNEAAFFFDRLIDGASLPAGSAILSTRNRLLSKDRLMSNERLEIILRGWNMHRSGKTNSGRSAPLSGSYPEVSR